MKTALRRTGAIQASIATCLILASACSSSSHSTSGTDAGSTTLTVAMKSATTIEQYIYLGEQKGVFAKHHVKVNIVYNNPPSALLVADRADLVVESPSYAALLAQKGKPVRIVASESHDAFVGLLSSPKIPNVNELRSLGSRCTIASQPPGASGYGFTLNYLKAMHLKCRVAIVPNKADAVNGVVSGSYSAVAETGGDPAATPAINKGAHWLANPNNAADVATYRWPTHFITTAIYSTPEKLSAHRAAITRFLSALLDAQKLGKAMSAAQVGSVLSRVRDFATLTPSQLAQQVNSFRSSVTYEAVSQAYWLDSLSTWARWKVPGLEPSNSSLGYSRIVDNSFIQAASQE